MSAVDKFIKRQAPTLAPESRKEINELAGLKPWSDTGCDARLRKLKETATTQAEVHDFWNRLIRWEMESIARGYESIAVECVNAMERAWERLNWKEWQQFGEPQAREDWF